MNKSLWKHEKSYGVDYNGSVAFFTEVDYMLNSQILWEDGADFYTEGREGMKIIIPKELLK